MAFLVDVLGSPHLAAPVIHVAGTNGKTSTARMIDSLLRAFGLTTGLFTSPHLHSITERIHLAGEPISAERFVSAYDDIEPSLRWADERSKEADQPVASYFEALTTLAFAAFADAPVDVAVIEVGMGGRWDATNVAESAVAVVTQVAMDHMDYLGTDLAAIAAEKAGILSADSVAVLAAQHPTAQAVLDDQLATLGARALRQGADFELLDRSVAVGGQLITVRGTAGEYPPFLLPLHGPHQAANAAVALAAVEAFLGGGQTRLDPDSVAAGFAAATSPGRLEVVGRQPLVVVDAAHNPAGMGAAVSGFAEAFAVDEFTLLIGMLADKDVAGTLAAAGQPDRVIVTTAPSPRSVPAAELGAAAADQFGADRVEVIERLPDAWTAGREAAAATPNGALLVAGSVTLAAQARLLAGMSEA